MRFREYYISNKEGKSNCLIRSFCKLFNKEYDDVYNELNKIAEELCYESFNDIEVFETYLNDHKMVSIEYGWDLKVRDLELEKGEYAIFCWDKKDFYHMVCLIDDVLYDKDEKCLDLYVVSIYKKEEQL